MCFSDTFFLLMTENIRLIEIYWYRNKIFDFGMVHTLFIEKKMQTLSRKEKCGI